MSVRTCSTALKRGLYNIGLTFVLKKQQDFNLTDIKKIVRDRCNYTERQNILEKLSGKGSLTLQ
jgi:hypothetical protein